MIAEKAFVGGKNEEAVSVALRDGYKRIRGSPSCLPTDISPMRVGGKYLLYHEYMINKLTGSIVEFNEIFSGRNA